MYDYCITPKAPLQFRDGKPFGSASEIAETLPFPLPSTIAGALRTILGDVRNIDFSKQASSLLKTAVAGPLLFEQEQNGLPRILLPAPADALCHAKEGKKTICPLRPKALMADEGMDLPCGDSSLLPVMPSIQTTGKPLKDAPHFWYLDRLTQWLAEERQDCWSVDDLGIGALPEEVRIHVAMDNGLSAGKKGMLFQTSGLDFSEQQRGDGGPTWKQRYGLLAQCAEALPATYRKLGGEARLAYVEPGRDLWPKCPSELKQVLSSAKGIRLVLATPAIFDQGWKPGWLDEKLEGAPPDIGGIKLKLRAAAIPRWQALSGWSMATVNGKPQGARPVRRMAPAGSVYWFEILEGDVSTISQLWLVSISDQQTLDGFGLVLPGIWNNLPK